MPAAGKGTEVTAERIEGALDYMAEVMSIMGAEGAAYLPIYERLENELKELRAVETRMAAVRERAERVKALRGRR